MTTLWALIEISFLIVGGAWIASLVALVVLAIWTATRARRSSWVSRADLFAFPEGHDPVSGSRFDPQ